MVAIEQVNGTVQDGKVRVVMLVSGCASVSLFIVWALGVSRARSDNADLLLSGELLHAVMIIVKYVGKIDAQYGGKILRCATLAIDSPVIATKRLVLAMPTMNAGVFALAVLLQAGVVLTIRCPTAINLSATSL